MAETVAHLKVIFTANAHQSRAIGCHSLCHLDSAACSLQALNGFLAKSDGKDKLTALVQVRQKPIKNPKNVIDVIQPQA